MSELFGTELFGDPGIARSIAVVTSTATMSFVGYIDLEGISGNEQVTSTATMKLVSFPALSTKRLRYMPFAKVST